jgi:hypothetical protein
MLSSSAGRYPLQSRIAQIHTLTAIYIRPLCDSRVCIYRALVSSGDLLPVYFSALEKLLDSLNKAVPSRGRLGDPSTEVTPPLHKDQLYLVSNC